MKKLSLTLIFVLVFMSIVIPTYSASVEKIQIMYNNQTVKIPTGYGYPYTKDGVIMIPAQFFGELLGFKVEYSSKDKRIVIKGVEFGSFYLTQGEKSMKAPDGNMTLNTTPTFKDGKLYIPLNFINQALGFSVLYSKNKDIQTVNIQEPNKDITIGKYIVKKIYDGMTLRKLSKKSMLLNIDRSKLPESIREFSYFQFYGDAATRIPAIKKYMSDNLSTHRIDNCRTYNDKYGELVWVNAPYYVLVLLDKNYIPIGYYTIANPPTEINALEEAGASITIEKDNNIENRLLIKIDRTKLPASKNFVKIFVAGYSSMYKDGEEPFCIFGSIQHCKSPFDTYNDLTGYYYNISGDFIIILLDSNEIPLGYHIVKG